MNTLKRIRIATTALLGAALLLFACGRKGDGPPDDGGGGGVDGIPPRILSVSPPNGATNQDPRSTIVVQFSEAIKVETLTDLNIVLTGQGGATACRIVSSLIPGTVSYDSSTNTAVFTPTKGGCTLQGLDFFETINVTAKKSITDLAGNLLTADPPCPPPVEGACWSFKTGDAGDTTGPTLAGTISCSDCAGGSPPISPTSFSLKLTWPAATDNATPAANITYEVCIQKTSCASSFTVAKSVTGSACPTACVTDVTGLETSTTYFFSVRAVDLRGNASLPLPEGSAQTKPGSWACMAKTGPDVTVATSTDWSRCTLAQNASKNVFSPSLVFVNGIPYVAWVEEGEGNLNHVFVKHHDGSTWVSDFGADSNGLNVNGNPNANPPTFTDAKRPRLSASGTMLYLAFLEQRVPGSGSYDIIVRRLETSGKSAGANVGDWITLRSGNPPTSPNTVSVNQFAFTAAKDAQGGDLPTVAWTQSTDPKINIKQWKEGTSTWDPVADTFTAVGTANFPALAANGAEIFFAWTDCPAPLAHCDLFAKRLGDSPSATLRVPQQDEQSGTFSGQIALTYIGSTPHIAWAQSTKSRDNEDSCPVGDTCLVYVKKFVAGTGSWGLIKDGSSLNAAAGRAPSIAGSDVPYIAVQAVEAAGVPRGRVVVRHFDGSKWAPDKDDSAKVDTVKALNVGGRSVSINFFPDDPSDDGGEQALVVFNGTPHVAYTEKSSSISPSSQPFVKRLK